MVLAALAGCRGDRSDKPPRQFFPDMDDSPKWKPQTESPFFADGRTMRLPPEGVVAYSRVSLDPEAWRNEPWAARWLDQREDLLKDKDGLYRGVDAQGNYLLRVPVAVTREMIERGRDRFDIYCSACHGYLGDGKGLVGTRFAIPVANFHDPKYTDAAQRTGTDGYIFHVIRNGVGGPDASPLSSPGAGEASHDHSGHDGAVAEPAAAPVLTMPSYAHALNERDAWAVVAYLRALQASRSGTLEDVPEEDRAWVAGMRPPPEPEPEPEAGGGA
jgi:mono/diheme cytochrome c family protein